MFIAFGAALALHLTVQVGQTPPRDQARVVRDSTPVDSTKLRAPRRLAVTSELLRTAFHDDQARSLLGRARRARLTLDSSLKSYDAKVRERLTAKLGIGARGPERVMYRQESAFRVQWQETIGARVEMTGARVGIPVAPASAEREALEESLTEGGMTPIPYFPGQESFGLGSRLAQAEVDDRGVVQPLAEGAEAYYTYASGDSMKWTLPGGRTVSLRELSVRPRSPKWNLAVGSLWFDTQTGQLVRAAYRLAVPIDVWARADERAREQGTDVNPVALMAIKALTSPLQVQISAVTVEYGLFDAKYWLPRSRSMVGFQRISFARMPIEIEQAFSYTTINAPTLSSASALVINAPDAARPRVPDSLSGKAARAWRDSAFAAYSQARKAFADSLHKAPCDSTVGRVLVRKRDDLAVAVTYPCDLNKLVSSADFTTSLYDSNEELFKAKDRDALIAESLPFGAQALIKFGALPRPDFQYGLSMSRYNRIEGFSTGVLVEQQFGAGYVGTAVGRLGAADREPNVELSIARTNLSKTITLNGYNRLVSAGDWGNPLSFGSSVSALFFGRDEGFYYRASGAELMWMTERGARLDWRLFGEQQRTAKQRTAYSFSGDFVPNIVATTGASAGAAVRWLRTDGLDPHGFRSSTDVRLEAAGGDSTYGRAAMEVTLSTGLPKSLAAAVTLAGGTSVGQVPFQRRWFLGGTQTIRGQSPDTAQSGNAFWMSRLEFGVDRSPYRIMLFGDLGWTGDRSAVADRVRPMSGAGIGLSMLDGLVRFDVARGFYPQRQTRVAAYLQARF